jgi:hypothetical protein
MGVGEILMLGAGGYLLYTLFASASTTSAAAAAGVPAWAAGTTYDLGAIVSYNGQVWISAINGNTSTPTQSLTGSWQLYGGAWSPTTTYQVGQWVSYGSSLYPNLTGKNTSTPPGTDATNWGLALTFPTAVSPSGAYTTALTSQPSSSLVPAPVSTSIPPSTAITSNQPVVVTPVAVQPIVTGTPISAPSAPASGCADADDNAMAAALAKMAAKDPALSSSGTMDGWQWDYYVVNEMNGASIVPGPTAAQMSPQMSACDYVALRAQFGQATGLSGLARMNVPLRWTRRQVPVYR